MCKFKFAQFVHLINNPAWHERPTAVLYILLTFLHPGSKNASKGASRATISKAVRDHAAMVHKSTVLCIVARTRMLDIAADDPEIQVRTINVLGAKVAGMRAHHATCTVPMGRMQPMRHECDMQSVAAKLQHEVAKRRCETAHNTDGGARLD